MRPTELRELKPGDRIRWVGKGQTIEGTVTARANGMAHIRWDDKVEEWLGWRSDHDRARGRNIEIIKPEQPA